MSDRRLLRHPQGFAWGYTAITRIGEADDTGIEFGILRLQAGQKQQVNLEREAAYLLIEGELELQAGAFAQRACRRSLFDQGPVVLHAGQGSVLRLAAGSACELALIQTANPRHLEPRLFDEQSMLQTEQRGRGQLDDAAYRIVRTVFDGRNRAEANLVLGEVITLPGRWSSYPPHHHPQPEIYHYRFTAPQGYGHAELGDEVRKVRQFDTIKILDQQDHAQVAAPGYGMYYLWAIRHLPGQPYSTPEFAAEHSWLNDPAAPYWRTAAQVAEEG